MESKPNENTLAQSSFTSSFLNIKTEHDSIKTRNSIKVEKADSERDNLMSKAINSRSHDGVFLRPDAVSSMLANSQHSPVSSAASSPTSSTHGNSTNVNRLNKRQSIDSGINMDAVRSTSRIGKPSIRDQLMKLNRFDRSMSLPLSSSTFLTFNSSNSITTAATSLAHAHAADLASAGIDSAIDSFSLSIDSAIDPNSFYSSGSNTSLSNASLLSPPRRMDFALCK